MLNNYQRTEKITTAPRRHRVYWIRWCSRRMRQVGSYIYVWAVAEPDGYERSFDSRLEAEDFIRSYNADARF